MNRQYPLSLRVLLVGVCAMASAFFGRAATLVHDFYIPMPEAQMRQAFYALETEVNNTINSTIAIIVTGDGTVVHYDHWEDGYEVDLGSPVQSTTQIWGDGNNANGIAPGFSNDPVGLRAGTVLTLANNVQLPRNPSVVLYDGRDRVAGTKALVISRMGYPTSPGPVLNDAVEVPATIDYGTEYVSPIGQGVGGNLFQYTALFVMASQDNTLVTVDVDGNGPTAPYNVTLNQGESHLVNGGVKKGATVRTTKPVQAQLIRGRINANYETDWFSLVPRSQWSSTYLTPVGSASSGNPTYVFLYNPNEAAITINATNRVGNSSFTISPDDVYRYQMPVNSGAIFTADGGEPFFALSVVAAQSSSQVYDWGFTLLPSDVLTPVAVVGLGLGSGGSQNGNPVWVTVPRATRVYVDLNGREDGPNTDPHNRRYDVHYDLVPYESKRIYDYTDNNQTAMRLFTADGTPISVAWGQDPTVAGQGNPYLDAGTTVLPFPVPVIRKSSRIIVDNPPADLSVGDILEYTVELDNKGLLPLGNLVVIDAPPPNLSYIPNTTTNIVNGMTNHIPDYVTGTPFPLDGPEGYLIPLILRAGTTKFTYHARIDAPGLINNTVTAAGYNVSTEHIVNTPPGAIPLPTVRFSDENGDAISYIEPGDVLYVNVLDITANVSDSAVDTIVVNVRNLTTGDAEEITLVETGPNTGVFRNQTPLTTSTTSGNLEQDGVLNVAAGNTISVLHVNSYGGTDSHTANVVTPSEFKQLYLSDGLTLDRINPVAVGDVTTAQTGELGATGTITVGSSITNSANSGTGSTFTVGSYTVTNGANRLLMVGISLEDDDTSGFIVNSVTFAGSNLVRLVKAVSTQEATSEIWYLLNPPVTNANIVVNVANRGNTDAIAAGAVAFYGVDQNTPFDSNNIVTSIGNNTLATISVNNADGQILFGVVGVDDSRTIDISNGKGTAIWNRRSRTNTNDGVTGGASWLSLVNGNGELAWTVGASDAWSFCAVPIRAAMVSSGNDVTFAQVPEFCSEFSLPAGGIVTVTNYVSVTSGTMPANPNVTATLRTGAGSFLTLDNPVYNAGSGALVWSGVLSSNVTIPAGQAIQLAITNSQSGVKYRIEYDSANKPSKITLPTTTIINVDSIEVYDAPYPGGELAGSGISGAKLYVRIKVSDPFGSYDITNLHGEIDGPGVENDISGVFDDSFVVADDGCSKIYEYEWQTGTTTGTYTISITAHEGSEGVSHSASTIVTLNHLDTGTPSSVAFTAGPNGAVTNSFGAGSMICVRVQDFDKNIDPAVVDSLSATVATATDSEQIILMETGPNTGIFVGCIESQLAGGSGDDNGVLNAPYGSVITLTYVDPDDVNDVSTATASIPNAVPSVSVTQTRLTSATAAIGQTVQFQISVVNNGNANLPGLQLVETFPASLTYVAASSAPNTVGGGSLTWNNVGPLAVGQSTNIIVTFTAASAGNANVTANVTGSASASGGAGVTIVNGSQLTITKTIIAGSNPAEIGENITFRIEVKNTGGLDIPSIPLEDSFSAACFEFVSATVAPDGTGASGLFWENVGPLSPGQSAIIDVVMRVKGGCDPAFNNAFVEYAEDVNGQLVPASSGSVSRETVAGSITGTVYDDKDQSGTVSPGDAGLANVTLTLYTDPDGNGDPEDGEVVRITTSGLDGKYELLNLTNGTYVVVQTLPAGYKAVEPSNSRLVVNVNSLIDFPNRHFFIHMPDSATYGIVKGAVYYDTDGDGEYNAGEPGIENVTLELIHDLNGNGLPDVGEPVVAFAVTTADGSYIFHNVIPNNYVIRKVDLYNHFPVSDTQGDEEDNYIAIAVGPSEVVEGNNFLARAIPTKVGFIQLPSDTEAGEVMDPIVVQLQDDNGNPVRNSGVTVTIALTSGTGELLGTLSGVTDENGTVTFDDLSIEIAGSKVLTVSSPGLTSGVSDPFEITAAAARTLQFVQHPSNATAGDVISPAITVRMLDQYGNQVPVADVDIEVELSSGNGTLSGTLVVPTDADGVATFDTLSVNLAGTKQLTAKSAGLTDAVSSTFTISAGAASKLGFAQQPTNTVAGETITPAVKVELQDTYGNLVSSSGVNITLSKTSGTGVLSGTLTVATVNGVATFSDLSIDLIGNKQLTANSAGLSGVSSIFTITAGSPANIVFVEQPSDVQAGGNFGPVVVKVTDQYGNPVSGVTVDLSLLTGSGTISGTVTLDTDSNGEASFDNVSITTSGDKTLRATAGSLTADSDSFTVSPGPATDVVLTGPSTTYAGYESGVFTLTAVDQYGNPTTVTQDTVFNLTSTSTGTFSFNPASPITILSGTGSATFTYTDDEIGTSTISVSRVSGDSLGGDSFDIEVVPADFVVALEFFSQPTLETSGEYFLDQPVIRALDGNGDFTTNISNLLPDDSLVTLTLIGGPGTLEGTLTLDLNSSTPGLLTWSNLLVNMPGTNWQLVASNSALGAITSSVFTVVSPVPAPNPFGNNGLPHALLSDAGPIGLWLADLRGDKYPWYTPSIGLLWRDLVVANYKSNYVTIRLCNDDGTFADPVSYETGLNPFAVRSGFFTSHVFEDVVVANFGTNTISFFETIKDGSGTLKPRVDYVIGSTPNPGPVSISVAAAFGAPYHDIFVANSNECTVSVLRNVNGTFTLTTNIPVGLHPVSVAAVDLDGDSFIDIVTANQGDHTVTILRGQPDFQFVHWKTLTLFPGGAPAPTHVNVHDINRDGLMDIAVANGASNSVSILLQTSDNEFPVFTNYSVGINPRSMMVRDLNRDEKHDIVVANFGGATLDILMGNGDGTFKHGGRVPTGRNPMCVVGSNFNNDRATDIAVSNFGDDTISIFLYSGPIAVNMDVKTYQNTPVDITLKGSLLNSTDIAYLVLGEPANGRLSGTPPNLVYTPNKNFVGTDTFQFQTFHTNYMGPERFQLPPDTGTFNTNFASLPATVTITVREVNQAPTFTVENNRIVVPSSSGLHTISNVVSNVSAGDGESDQSVVFEIRGINRSMYNVQPSLSVDGILTFEPSLKAVGTNVLRLILKDDGPGGYGHSNTSAEQEIEIVILPNQAPSFQLSTTLVTAQQFEGTLIVPGFATDITAGENEVAQSVNFITTVTNKAFFAELPQISPNGELRFAPSWQAAGTNYVTVVLKDDGSTASGGVNQSVEQVFAIYVPADDNPFAGLKSISYNGLFGDSVNGITHQSAGYVTVKVNAKMTFSGKLMLDGNSVGFSGKFNNDGTASVVTKTRQKKFDKPELNIDLVLSVDDDFRTLTGTISEDSNWTAELVADRVIWSPTNIAEQATIYTNKYTMLLPGFDDKTQGPAGTGYSLVNVDLRGRIKMSGAMGDGMVLKQSTFVSANGYWPLYVPGYRVARTNEQGRKVVESKGFVLGWLNFHTNSHGNMAPKGDFAWINTGWTNTTYANGFTNLNVAVEGSRWIAPVRGATEAVIDMSKVVITFSEGDLDRNGFSARFLVRENTTLGPISGVVNPNSTRAGLAPKTGAFKGTFLHPESGLPTRYFGVLLQDQNFGKGYFMGTTESGGVELNPAVE